MINNRNMFLINGQIVSSKKEKIEVVNFEQLDINLADLSTSVIKKPKLQETSTINLINCLLENSGDELCKSESSKLEILPNLIRRIILPFYMPAIALLCCFLLIKNNSLIKEKFFIYSICFFLLVFTELIIRYTGVNYILRIFYISVPFFLTITLYSILIYKVNQNSEIR